MPYNPFNKTLPTLSNIEVIPNRGNDLLDTWNAYRGERNIIVPKGTYALPSPLYIPDNATSEDIALIGAGERSTIITGGVGLTDHFHIESLVAAGNKGKKRLFIDGLGFLGSSASYEIGAVNANNMKFDVGTIDVNGAFKDAASDFVGLFTAQTSGDTNRAQSIKSLTIYPTTNVHALAAFKCDGLAIQSLAFNHSAASGTHALSFQNKISIQQLTYYIGDGKTLTDLIFNPAAAGHLDVQLLSGDRSTTGLVTNMFHVDVAASLIHVGILLTKATAVYTNLYQDATAQAATLIELDDIP